MGTEQYDNGGVPGPYGEPWQQPAPWGTPPAGHPQQQAPIAYGGYGAPAGYAYPGRPAPTNGLGIAGFVTGLVGLVLVWVPLLGLLLAGCGVVLSAVGMSQGSKTGAGTGLAIAGLVLGILALIPGLFVLLAVASAP